MTQDIVERLRAFCIDWDQTEMPDGAEPMSWVKCGDLREAASEIEALRKGLEPFATWAADNTDDDGWAGLRCEGERIKDWFGPSDFRKARSLLKERQG